MGIDLIFFLVLVIASFILFIFFIYRKIEEKTNLSQEVIEWLKTTSAQVDQKLSDQMKIFNERIDRAYNLLGSFQKEINQLTIMSDSLKKLEDYFHSAKIRGGFGEQILAELLRQFLPPASFKLQYRFKNGQVVDAVIFSSSGLIPIDSKFPLDNFSKSLKASGQEKDFFYKKFLQDVRKHIESISEKYIRVDEGTVDFALMYLPSEAVYYEVIRGDEFWNSIYQKKVIPVSPLSFFAYLRAVLVSFESQKIAKRAKEIQVFLQGLRNDFSEVNDSFLTLSRHLTNAYNQLRQVDEGLRQISQKLTNKKILLDTNDQE